VVKYLFIFIFYVDAPFHFFGENVQNDYYDEIMTEFWQQALALFAGFLLPRLGYMT